MCQFRNVILVCFAVILCCSCHSQFILGAVEMDALLSYAATYYYKLLFLQFVCQVLSILKGCAGCFETMFF